MKRDFDTLNDASLTFRLPHSLAVEIRLKAQGPKYRDLSDATRSLVMLGLRVESLLDIQSDPEKKKEFEEKFASLLKEKDIEKSLETMDDDQLRGVSFFIENLKNKKVQMLIDELKTS